MDTKDWIQVKFMPTQSKIKVTELIKKLYKTHEVIVTESGTIYIKKK